MVPTFKLRHGYMISLSLTVVVLAPGAAYADVAGAMRYLLSGGSYDSTACYCCVRSLHTQLLRWATDTPSIRPRWASSVSGRGRTSHRSWGGREGRSRVRLTPPDHDSWVPAGARPRSWTRLLEMTSTRESGGHASRTGMLSPPRPSRMWA